MQPEVVHLNIRGMSCGGCAVKLSKRFYDEFPQVKFAANFADQSGVLVLPEKKQLKPYLEFIKKCGYQVETRQEAARKEIHLISIRLAVAFFCFMNVMLFALVEYLSAPGELALVYQSFFRQVSAALTTVSVFFCGWPILSQAWHSMVSWKPSVDLTIAAAIIATYIYSLASLSPVGSVEPYFDSVTAIIFFLLAGRSLQQSFFKKAHQHIRSHNQQSALFVKKEGAEHPIDSKTLVTGDVFSLQPGDVVPVKSTLLSPNGLFSLDLITGETLPQPYESHKEVVAGAVCYEQKVVLKALEDGRESYLCKLQDTAFEMSLQKSKLMQASDRLATWFFVAVVAVAAACLAVHWSLSPQEAFFRTIAILLIACPCAFALAVPLAAARCGFEGLKKKVLFGHVRAMEQLPHCHNLIFDKTGTLTRPNLAVTKSYYHYDLQEVERLETQAFILAAAQHTKHATMQALAKSIAAESPQLQALSPVSCQEVLGQGMLIQSDKRSLRIGRASFCKMNEPAFFGFDLYVCDSQGHFLAGFNLEGQPVEGLESDLTALRTLGLDLFLLSGDSSRRTQAFAAPYQIDAAHVIAESSPESKSEVVKKLTPAAMVGNGFNDLLAFSKSNVSIATQNSDPSSYRLADVKLLQEGVSGVVAAFQLSATMQKNLRYAFMFSAVFNILGIVAAWHGFVVPVVAAILMPINGFIVGSLAAKKR